jgi:hypothetical protein
VGFDPEEDRAGWLAADAGSEGVNADHAARYGNLHAGYDQAQEEYAAAREGLSGHRRPGRRPVMTSTPQQYPSGLTCTGCLQAIGTREFHIRQNAGPGINPMNAPTWHDVCLPDQAVTTGQHFLTGFPR